MFGKGQSAVRTWGWVLCLIALGCRTTQHTEAYRTQRPMVGSSDVEVAEHHFDECTTAFFKEDWETTISLSAKLQQASQQWQQEAKSLPAEDPFVKHATLFSQAAERLHAAASSKNVNKTTTALRDVSRHLAALKKLNNETSETPSAQTAEPKESEPTGESQKR